MARTTLRLISSLLAAGLPLSASENATTLRDALLCEAHKRISGWYEGGQKPTTKKFSQDGIELRFLNEFLTCGGQDSIVTFANFTVEDVEPIHVYSAIVDIVGQKAWNPAAHEIKKLHDNTEQGVRGVKLLYFAQPFQDRKVYEYEAYDLLEGDSWKEGKDLWFAASSCNDLKEYDHDVEQEGFLGMAKPVLAYSCLSAHHVRWAPDGKSVYASLSNTINGKPPFGLAPTMISEMTWGKTVDFIKALRIQAKKIKALGKDRMWTPPEALSSTKAKKYTPGENCKALVDAQPINVIGLSEHEKALKEELEAPATSTVSVAVACVAMLASAVGLVVRRRWRAPEAENLLSVE